MQNQDSMQKESCILTLLGGVEDLAEKKMKIYSRLLMDMALASDMEQLAARHAKRKTTLKSLASGKAEKCEKRKKEAGMCETNGEEGEQ